MLWFRWEQNNIFGLPSEAVIQQYQQQGVIIIRTDQNGAPVFLAFHVDSAIIVFYDFFHLLYHNSGSGRKWKF
jgi:hypothetical protein